MARDDGRKRFARLGCAAAAAVALLATAAGAAVTSVQGTAWKLAEVAGKPAVAGGDAGMTLANGRVAGSTGVNRFTGPYTISGADRTLTFGPAAATQRAGAPAAMAQEAALLKALAATASYRLDGGVLELRDAGGATLAKFAPAPTPAARG